MADISLTSLRDELAQKTAPFTVEFTTENGVKEVGFYHLLTVDSKTRVAYYELLAGVGKVSQEEAEKNPDPYLVSARKIRDMMGKLSTDRAVFRELSKAIGDDFMLWDSILGNYFEHFRVDQGE